ncbi:hypothetical protein HAX54_007409 [Datura stramonium]|uniref:RRM domain-containing protein n=1 Tax=Datura stramonium TaxID=4076 RepID=A0ABS8TE53_DATST|nr:hypothetical protein [Datura stramonium]
MNEDEFKGFFSKYGKVTDCEIIRDHVSKRSRGFGFIVFDNEQIVDNLLSEGNMIDMLGSQVEIKKAEPKKPSNPASGPAYGSDSRGRAYNDSYGGFGNSYSSFGSGGFGPASSYRSSGGMSGRFGDYGYEVVVRFGGSRYGSYAGGFGGGAGGYGGGGLMSAYGRGAGYRVYGGAGSGAGYESGPGAGYGGPGGLYGSRTGYSGSGRYHPYARILGVVRFSLLVAVRLEPSLVYEYGLAFAYNELEYDDVAYFNYEFLKA